MCCCWPLVGGGSPVEAELDAVCEGILSDLDAMSGLDDEKRENWMLLQLEERRWDRGCWEKLHM